ncbi:hypothetical protein CBS101457_005352 [Exobasidium rhododendri]|nr:hypothetical protein CBS101457_005352 [Exobasidium rhododendri]
MHPDSGGTMLYDEHIAAIRAAELPDLELQVYLDSSGSPPVPRSLLNAVHDRLINGPMVSNPHSNSPSGQATMVEMDQVRSLVCKELFKVDRRGGRVEEAKRSGLKGDAGWELVFTSGTTAGLQNVARYFDFKGKGRFGCLEQSHSSLFGLRDIVTEERGDRGAEGCDVVEERTVVDWVRMQSDAEGVSLLALPLQCNATGKRYNDLVSSVLTAREEAEKANISSPRKIFILLDIASYLSPSTNLPLHSDSSHQPDFLCFSFLKILGYPSGLGGLLILRESAPVLLTGKQYYGGGTLEAVTSRQRWKQPSTEIHVSLEDGTQNVFGIIAVKSALESLQSDKLLKSWDQASDYVDRLTDHLYNSLRTLKHGNNSSLVELYSQQSQTWSTAPSGSATFHRPNKTQGPIVLFNILRPESDQERGASTRIDPSEVDRLACVDNIHMRSGRMCNIGAITKALDITEDDIKALWERGIGCGSVAGNQCADRPLGEKEEDRLQMLISGCLRVSLSVWNTRADVDQLVFFLKKYFIEEDEKCVEGSDYGSCDEEMEADDDCWDCDSDSGEERASSDATSKTSHSIDEEESSPHCLEELHLYPIKSCAFQPLTEEWKLTATGLEYDRQFCIVDLGSGKVMSQKQIPKMTRIRPRVCLESGTLQIALLDPMGEVQDQFSVPLEEDQDGKNVANHGRGFDMCGKTLSPTLLMDEAVRAPLSSFLARECTLGRYSRESGHQQHDRTPLLFSNESPFLLISSESVAQVCRWIREEEEMEADQAKVQLAFRSNFIISSRKDSDADDSDGAFEEEANVSRVVIGPHTFTVMGPCRRCQMIALDQTTGHSASEILSVVARHCRCQSGRLKGRILFGIHLQWQSEWTLKEVMIKSGMPVRLLRTT